MTTPIPGGDVGVESSGSVTTIRWNRPTSRNAIDSATALVLVDAIRGAARTAAAIVLWPQPQFCSGWDLAELRSVGESGGIDAVLDAGEALLETLRSVPSLVVAIVEQGALGFGVAVASQCDVVVAADDARFALPEIKVGMVPASVMPHLVNSLGSSALELALGAEWDAGRAVTGGLVDRIRPSTELSTEVDELVARCAALPTDAQRRTVELHRQLAALAPADRVAHGRAVTNAMFSDASA